MSGSDEHFEDLCTSGAIAGLARTMRESAQRIAAADQEHRSAMATLLALHERTLARQGDGTSASASELAALRAAELNVTAAAEQRVAIAREALDACRDAQTLSAEVAAGS